jgi:hypothetical protein
MGLFHSQQLDIEFLKTFLTDIITEESVTLIQRRLLLISQQLQLLSL